MPTSHDERPLLVIGRDWLLHDNPRIDWITSCIHIVSSDGSRWTIKPRGYEENPKKIHINAISLKRMSTLVRRKRCELFAVQVHPNVKSIKISEPFQELVSEFNDIFLDELPDKLPPHREVDFEINLKSDEPQPVRPIIRLSQEELKELKKQLQMLLDKGLIRPSS